MFPIRLATLGLALAISAPLTAKDSLGMFSDWGAFRDGKVPRCYAIAMPAPSSAERTYAPFMTVSSWPKRQLRGQVYFRLSRDIAPRAAITLNIGGKQFRLTGGGANAWAQDRTMDAAIVAAMRSATTMTVRAADASGRRFSNSYTLAGAASAMDAATLACARS